MQQLGCLPPQSSALLPASYRPLVLDPKSPIIQFYPTTFAIDMNNKVNPWEGVNLIPFIEEKALRDAVRTFVARNNAAWLIEKNGHRSPDAMRAAWHEQTFRRAA